MSYEIKTYSYIYREFCNGSCEQYHEFRTLEAACAYLKRRVESFFGMCWKQIYLRKLSFDAMLEDYVTYTDHHEKCIWRVDAAEVDSDYWKDDEEEKDHEESTFGQSQLDADEVNSLCRNLFGKDNLFL